jgi:hypothetical protein
MPFTSEMACGGSSPKISGDEGLGVACLSASVRSANKEARMRSAEEILGEQAQLDPKYVVAGMFNGAAALRALATMRAETVEACANIAQKFDSQASAAIRSVKP